MDSARDGSPPPFLADMSRVEQAAALALLAVGAALRFYDLGGHSQWYDEMLVTVHSSFGPGYVLDLCWRAEIHPPAYYILASALQAAWPSDFFLRLPSALAGVASLPLIGAVAFRLSARLGSDARFVGLAAMALACVNPMHIWISRQVRPYALMQVLACLAVLALARLLRRPGRGGAVRLALFGAAMAWLHYLGLVFLAGQGLALLAVRLLRPAAARARDILAFALAGLGCALPVLPFLVSAKWLHASPFLTTAGDMSEATSKMAFSILRFWNFGYFDGTVLWALPALATALGLALLWRTDAVRGAACLTLLASFPLLLLAAGYSGHFTPVHLSFLLPVVFACQAVAFRGLLTAGTRRAWAAPALAALLGAVFLNQEGRAFYHPDREVADAWHHQERYKAIARFLAANAGPDSFPVLDNPFAAQAVDWYLGALSLPLSERALTPDRKPATLLYFSKERDLARPGASPAFIRRALTPPARQGEVGRMDLYMLPVTRAGQVTIGPGNRAGGGTFEPDALLRDVRALSGMRLYAEDDFWLCPARPREPGHAVFRFASAEPVADGAAYIVLDAQVSRPGNEAAVEVSFDEGPYQRVVTLDTPWLGGPVWARVNPGMPFTAMDVRLSLTAPARLADRVEGPLVQARARSLRVFLPAPENRFHSPGLEVAESGLGVPEPDGRGGMFRWGLDRTRLEFALERPGKAAMAYRAETPVPGQRGRVAVNGVAAGTIDLSGRAASGRLEFEARHGLNVVEIAWEKSNSGPDAFAPLDHRPLAVAWSLLCVEPAAPAP